MLNTPVHAILNIEETPADFPLSAGGRSLICGTCRTLIKPHAAEPVSAMPRPKNLYDVARNVCHEFGMDWTDPRTGKLHKAPARKINT